MNRIFFHHISKNDIPKYEQSSIYLHRPHLIGFYEYNTENIIPAQRLKYFREPKPSDYPINLNEGRENMVFFKRHPQQSRLYIPLLYARSSDATIAISEDGVELTHVYTNRRLLTRIMAALNTRYDFVIDISRFNGSLYMCGSIASVLPEFIVVNQMRLDQLLFTDTPHDSPKLEKTFDSNLTLSCLHRTTLGKYDLIYAGEAQGVLETEEFHKFEDLEALNKLRFVFTKQKHDIEFQEFTKLTYWIPAYLANVEDIYVALKDYNGIVTKPLKHIQVSNIPKNCSSWTPQICVGLLNEFLERVEKLMVNVDSLDTVYEFQFSAKDKTYYYTVHEGKTEKSFISQEYATKG